MRYLYPLFLLLIEMLCRNIVYASSYDLNAVDSASLVSDELLAHYYQFIASFHFFSFWEAVKYISLLFSGLDALLLYTTADTTHV